MAWFRLRLYKYIANSFKSRKCYTSRITAKVSQLEMKEDGKCLILNCLHA